MKLNIYTVIDCLREEGWACVLNTASDDIAVDCVKFFANDVIAEGTLYIARDRSTENHTVVMFDRGSLSVNGCGPDDLFAQMLIIFRRYQALEDRALHALFYEYSLEEIVGVASELFGCPVLIVGEDRRLLVGSEEDWLNAQRQSDPGDTLSFEFSGKMQQDAAPQPTRYALALQLRSAIWMGNSKVGRIVVHRFTGQVHPGTVFLLRWITQIAELFIALSPQSSHHATNISQKLYMLLIAQEQNVSELERTLENLNWESGNRYIFLIVAGFTDTDQMDTLVLSIQEECREFRYIYHEDVLILLGNLTYEPAFISVVRRRVGETAFALHIGLGYPFYGWNNLLRFYRQARSIARAASQLDIPELNAATLTVQHLTDVVAAVDELSCLEHPDIKLLRQHDREKATTFTETLRGYLFSGCRVEMASNLLGIHPNTLRYRLGRIERILDCNLYDSEYRRTLTYAMLLPDS